MPVTSSLRSQRLSSLDHDTAHQYVIFRLRLAWFMLPIESIYRVLPLDKHIPQLTLSGSNVPILDVGKVLFGKVQSANFPQLTVNGAVVASKPSLLVVRGQSHLTNTEGLVGILSNSQPALQKITDDQMVPLPPTYSQQWKVDFISLMTLPSQDRPSLFVIDSDRLISSILQRK